MSEGKAQLSSFVEEGHTWRGTLLDDNIAKRKNKLLWKIFVGKGRQKGANTHQENFALNTPHPTYGEKVPRLLKKNKMPDTTSFFFLAQNKRARQEKIARGGTTE